VEERLNTLLDQTESDIRSQRRASAGNHEKETEILRYGRWIKAVGYLLNRQMIPRRVLTQIRTSSAQVRRGHPGKGCAHSDYKQAVAA